MGLKTACNDRRTRDILDTPLSIKIQMPHCPVSKLWRLTSLKTCLLFTIIAALFLYNNFLYIRHFRCSKLSRVRSHNLQK